MNKSIKNLMPMAGRMAVVMAGAALLAAPAHAAGGTSNLEPLAQAILDLLTGNVARIFAAIAVVIVGYLYWAGRGSAQLLFTVLIGCFFVFSSRWIIDQIIT